MNLFNSSLSFILLSQPHDKKQGSTKSFKTSSFSLSYPWCSFDARTPHIEPCKVAYSSGCSKRSTPAPIGLVGPTATLNAATRQTKGFLSHCHSRWLDTACLIRWHPIDRITSCLSNTTVSHSGLVDCIPWAAEKKRSMVPVFGRCPGKKKNDAFPLFWLGFPRPHQKTSNGLCESDCGTSTKTRLSMTTGRT